MNTKMKSCFTPHVIMHSLFGLGLGLFLASLFPVLAVVWLGLVLMLAAVIWDMMRK